jgi:hypothetical protein
MRWEDLWEGADDGLIACWERGREMAAEVPALVARMQAGELVVLPWSGGYEHEPGKKVPEKKQGSRFYLAMRQGLLGEDLDVDPAVKVRLTCSVSGVVVTFKPVAAAEHVESGETDELFCAPDGHVPQ